MDNKPIGSTNMTKLSFWGAATAKQEIETIKGDLFAGHEISWFKLADISILRFLQAYLSSDYAKFIENEFQEFKALQQKPEILNNQRREAVILETDQNPDGSPKLSPELQSQKFQEIKSKAMPRDMDNINSQLQKLLASWDRSLFLNITGNVRKDFNGTLGEYRIKVIATLVTDLLNAAENSSDIGILKNSLQKLQKDPNTWLSTSSEENDLGLELRNDKALAKKTDELLQIVEAAESKAKSEEDALKANTHTDVAIPNGPTRNTLKDAMSILDKKLIQGSFAMRGNLAREAIADVRKGFNGSIVEYRIQVITAIVTKIVDSTKDDLDALSTLKMKLGEIKKDLEVLNVLDEEDNLNLNDDTVLVGKIDELLQAITTAEIRSIVVGTKKKILNSTGDLTTLTNIKRDFDAQVATNPEIRTYPRFKEAEELLNASILAAKYYEKGEESTTNS